MKQLVSMSLTLCLVTLVWCAAAFTEPPPAPRGELRIVDTRAAGRFSVEVHVLERLVEVNHDGTVVPRLASGWQWLDDRTLAMTLRRGVTFHNGEVFDAEVVKLNWDFRMEYSKDSNTYATNLQTSFPPASRLEMLDPSTIRFVLPGPDAGFLVNLGVMRMANRQFYQTLHQRVAEEHKPRARLFFSTLRQPGPWGTGPYRWVEGRLFAGTRDTDTDHVILEANPSYWDTERFPKVQRLVFDNTRSVDEATALIKTSEGQVDVLVSPYPLDTLRVAQSPFATVVKERSALSTIHGLFNRRKGESPWHDVRMRQAVNYAINRAHFLRYAAKGNGIITPALLPPGAFGFDPTLTPYPFDPVKARRLLREAGYPEGLSLTLVAPEEMAVQATVVSKMLEQVGCTVAVQLLARRAYHRSVDLVTFLTPHAQHKQRPWPTWDIALQRSGGGFLAAHRATFPARWYANHAVSGRWDWIGTPTALHRLHTQLIGTMDRAQQEQLFHRMERYAYDQAHLLFLYAPIQLYAVNKEVTFVPHPSSLLYLNATSVTDQHWSVRKAKVAGQP